MESIVQNTKWSVELNKFKVRFLPRASINSHAPVDFIANCFDLNKESTRWLLQLNMNAIVQWAPHLSRIGGWVVLTSLTGENLLYTLHIEFQATNNMAKYVGLLASMPVASTLGIYYLLVRGYS